MEADAADSSGNIYAANRGTCVSLTGTDSVTVYAAHSDGDAGPIATIAGKRTCLLGPSALAIGPLAP